MAAGVGVGVGVAFGCAAFDFFFCLLLFAAVAAAVVVVVVFVVAAALLGVFVGAAAAAVGIVCCCFCGLASFSPALISLLLLGACFFFFFFFFLAVSGVTVVVVVVVSDVTADLERFLGFSSGNKVLCLQTAQSTACGNKEAFKSSERERERELPALTTPLHIRFFIHLARFRAAVLKRPLPFGCLALITSSWAISLRRLALFARRCGFRCS